MFIILQFSCLPSKSRVVQLVSIWSLYIHLHPLAHPYGLWSEVHPRLPSIQDSDLHPEEAGYHGGTSPVNMCCSAWACPSAWGQLGSRFYGQRPPWKALIDWRLIFLTGWHPATKPRNSTEDWERGKNRAFIWQRETDEVQVLKEKKEKCLCSCLSDDTDYTVVILDWYFDLLG